MTGMCRQELKRSLPAGGLSHPLPEANRLSGIVSCLGCQENADIVCFRFMRAAEREQDTHMGAEAEGGHGVLRQPRIRAARAQGNLRYFAQDIDHRLLAHALSAMTRERMSHLVTQHSRQAGFRL